MRQSPGRREQTKRGPGCRCASIRGQHIQFARLRQGTLPSLARADHSMIRATNTATGSIKPSGVALDARTTLQCLFLVITLLSLLPLFGVEVRDLDLVTLSNIASVYMLLITSMVLYISPHGVWSASTIYLIVFSVFHFGLTLVFGLGLPVSNSTLIYLSGWFYTPFTVHAITLAIV